jgi:hypothetical protein
MCNDVISVDELPEVVPLWKQELAKSGVGTGTTDAMNQWMKAQWEKGEMVRPSTALAQLRADPEEFLRKCPIINQNVDPSVNGVLEAYLKNGVSRVAAKSGNAKNEHPGKYLRTLRFHGSDAYVLELKHNFSANGAQFDVYGLATVKSFAGPNWYLLDDQGPDIMLTAKLTGCTFVARPGANANTVEVAHLQPNADAADGLVETGRNLNIRMKGIHNDAKAYGRLKYDFETRSINVIGVRVNGTWKIYAQKLQKNGLPKVLSVKRIWPA